MARIARVATILVLGSLLIWGCTTGNSGQSGAGGQEESREARLEGIHRVLYQGHEEVVARYEEQERRYLELELGGKIEGEMKAGLSQMRGMYLEMQEQLGRVLESHHRRVGNHREVRLEGEDELDEARDDYVHYHGLEVLQGHHERLMGLHRKMGLMAGGEGYRDLARGHQELVEVHRELRGRCREKMEVLEEEFDVKQEHQELIEPFELLPEEEPGEEPQLI